jgi:hypothetical protein
MINPNIIAPRKLNLGRHWHQALPISNNLQPVAAVSKGL